MKAKTKHTRSRPANGFALGFACTALAIGMSVPAMNAVAGNTYDNSYCDAFCDQLVDVNNGQVLGLNGQDGWTEADDEACAVAEGASPAPSPTPGYSPLPMPSTQSQGFQCEWHAGQALNYCQAYVLPQGSIGFEKTLAVLDTAAAATCWTACFQPTNPIVNKVCSYAAMGASAVEFVDTLTMNSSALSKALDATLAAAGISGGIMTALGVGSSTAITGYSTTTVGSTSLSDPTVISKTDIEPGQASSGQTLEVGSPKKTTTSSKLLTCGTAAVMTAMAAMRMKDMVSAENTQQNACNSIQQLGSNAPTISVSLTSTANGVVGTSGTVLPPAGAMAQANGPLGNGKQPAASVACASNGLGTGGCGFTAQQLSAPDAQMLNSGLGQAIAPQAAQQASGLLSQLGSSGSAGGTVGQALSNSAPNGDIAKAISTLAAKAADAPGSLGGNAPMSGGAGGGSGASQKQSSVFSFGMGDSAPTADVPEKTFQAAQAEVPAPSGDIFHSGFKGSIFDIVSQKMSTLHSRVDQLGWSTPLNRALAGGGSSSEPAPIPQGVNP